MNCHFPSRQGLEKNEVDIIINAGSKILFVECKTQITKNIDIDKFRSVVKTYGGIGSKALFVTDASMSELARQKCEDHGILTFSLKDYSNQEVAQKELFKMLDEQLFVINTK